MTLGTRAGMFSRQVENRGIIGNGREDSERRGQSWAPGLGADSPCYSVLS